MAAIAIARAAGVAVTYGSDLLGAMRRRQLEGFRHLLDAGLAPADALAAATRVGAAALGVPAGEIAPGRLCDLAVLRRDPLDEAVLRTLAERDVAQVYVGGVASCEFPEPPAPPAPPAAPAGAR